MIDTLLSIVAPHPCCGCGKIGAILCDNCKYNIADSTFDRCLLCSNKNIIGVICSYCSTTVKQGWCIGERTDELRRLIDTYKFENARSAYKVLADLLDEQVDQLPSSTVVVPIPTISSHIRQRGYDHAALLAKRFARQRNHKYTPILRRITNTSQRNAAKTQRINQAKVTFAVTRHLSPNRPYLLIDDVITTGSTLTYAAKALRNAGAQEVWIAAVARQPLD